MKITVFTPTYNREEKLKRLYYNLLKQTDQRFEWLIVDDGSNDDTKELVYKIIKENTGFEIRYYRKDNGGKHTAYNVGVEKANGELFVCVDSDDYLEATAVEKILRLWETIKVNSYIGIVALKKDTDGRLLSERLPNNIQSSKIIDLARKYNCKGEFSLVFATRILKRHVFPIVENEKFMCESIIYDQVDENGEMYLFNEVITVCEYCDDGYTRNFLRVVLDNPTGYKLYYKQRIDLAITLKEKINYILRYHAFKIMSKDDRFEYDANSRVLVKVMLPLGYLAYLLYERKKKNYD